MNRSDRMYLSKYALDPDPDYLDIDDFDLDHEFDSDVFYDDDFEMMKKKSSDLIRRLESNESKTAK